MEERRIAKFGQRLDDAAAGAEQQSSLVGDYDFRFVAMRRCRSIDRRSDAR